MRDLLGFGLVTAGAIVAAHVVTTAMGGGDNETSEWGGGAIGGGTLARSQDLPFIGVKKETPSVQYNISLPPPPPIPEKRTVDMEATKTAGSSKATRFTRSTQQITKKDIEATKTAIEQEFKGEPVTVFRDYDLAQKLAGEGVQGMSTPAGYVVAKKDVNPFVHPVADPYRIFA